MPPRAEPLTRPQCLEVLRYWRAALRLEEALGARPRARRGRPERAVPRVDIPTSGQEYFKVALDQALFDVLAHGHTLRRTLDPEAAAYFETWLANQYRRGEGESPWAHWLAFPVVHLPRGELAGLLRMRLDVFFGYEGGSTFDVPSYAQRRAKRFPAPPDELRIHGPERKQGCPVFIDTRLWSQSLGVTETTLDGLFEALQRTEDLAETEALDCVARALEAEVAETTALYTPGPLPSVATLVERICNAAETLLARHGRGARLYRVGIVLDASRARTTSHLQREIQALLGEREGPALPMAAPLAAYLSGDAPAPGNEVQRASFPGSHLTGSQRAAAEQAWGSTFTAVQGPPGTGKTTLILHLCAEAIVRQVEALLTTGTMGAAPFVVTSTNNRAVDNVIDPLIALDHDLPLALRAGSRDVCERRLAPQLQRARTWLASATEQPLEQRKEALRRAREAFVAIRDRVDALHADRAARFERARKCAELRAELARLEREPEDPEVQTVRELGITPALVATFSATLSPLVVRLEALAQRCEAGSGTEAIRDVVRHYRWTAAHRVAPLLEALAAAGIGFELGLPPVVDEDTDPDEVLEAWLDATEVALARVLELESVVLAAGRMAVREQRRASVQRELDTLQPEPAANDAPWPAGDETLPEALFLAAVELRKAWAAARAESLQSTVALALHAASEDRSLRALLRRTPQAWHDLQRLFGLWGCTLLSLGNVFEAEPDVFDRVVIDEAGQCHPAYAVSALLRAHAALVIGDVHQLEPVVELTPADEARVLESARLTLPTSTLAPYRVHATSTTSVQSLADRAVELRPRLRDHFRCQQEIIRICDALCGYGLQIHTPRRDRSHLHADLSHPVLLVDHPGEQERIGGTWHNRSQCATAVELVEDLLAHGLLADDIAVITPYRGQLELLRRTFAQRSIPLHHDEQEGEFAAGTPRGITAGTVHRFQGGERSIVVFTSVVTRATSLAFLDERANLLNVALSRARDHFIAIGDRKLLAGGRRTSQLVAAARPWGAR